MNSNQSESLNELKDIINEQKKNFENSSLCHNQIGRCLKKLSSWFQFINGFLAAFITTKASVEYQELKHKNIGEIFFIGLGIISGLLILGISVYCKIDDPAKNAELHFQKADMLDKLNKYISYCRIKCKTYEDYNKLYLEIEKQSAELPLVRITDWSRYKVNKQLSKGSKSIQEMRYNRRKEKLDRLGIKLNNNDQKLYKGMEKLNVDELRNIACSSTIQNVSNKNYSNNIPIKLMNHEDLLDFLKCDVKIRSNNLTEQHRNEILHKINNKIIENHLLCEVSRVHDEKNNIKPRRLSLIQQRINDDYKNEISKSEILSEVMSEIIDDENYRNDNVEGLVNDKEMTWQESPPSYKSEENVKLNNYDPIPISIDSNTIITEENIKKHFNLPINKPITVIDMRKLYKKNDNKIIELS